MTRTKLDEKFETFKATYAKDIFNLLKYLITTIDDDYRASETDEEPGMQVTISTNDTFNHYRYQTGDNSFTGSCYHDPHWAVIYLYRDSNPHDLAVEAIYELGDVVYECTEFTEE